MGWSTPMTVGQLARRTGVPAKALREYERLGWLYSRGRSEGNYRLFDEEALWCVRVITSLRAGADPARDRWPHHALHRAPGRADRPGARGGA
jgi:hypothetical protein